MNTTTDSPMGESPALALMARGYHVVPIRAGTKVPAYDKWQETPLMPRTAPRYRKFGLGILTGYGPTPLAAVDLDIYDAQVAEHMAAWCMRLGAPLVRVGMAPKTLLLFRTETTWKKKTSTAYEYGALRNRIEVLGSGQQFVAYGIHPDTGSPYRWIDALGGPTALDAADLPELAPEDVDALFAEFYKMAAEKEWPVAAVATSETKTTSTASAEDWAPPPSPPTEAQRARIMAQCLDPRFVSHVGTEAEWKKFISAVAHIPDDGAEWARNLAHEVSAKAANYKDAADVDAELDRAAANPGAWPALINTLEKVVGPWAPPSAVTATGGARILLVDDMLAAKPVPHIVKTIIPQASVGVIYGMPNAGKSFLSWLIAGGIAQGEPVLGCRSRQSPVLVVSYEGHGGLRQRVAAHRAEGIFPPGVGIAFSASAPLLKNDAGGNHIITDIHATEMMTGMANGIVFVDTLAASIGGGNENAEGMAEALSQARRIRTETGWAVAFLHHVGKDVSKGPRGGSGLMGDADFALEVEAAATAGDVRTATLAKSRDSVAGLVWGFKLKVVDLGTDEDGEVVTSCVAYSTDVPATAVKPTASAARYKEPRGNLQRAVWRAANDLADLAFDDDAEFPTEMVLREALAHVTAVPGKRDRRMESLARTLDGMAGQGGVWAKGGTVYVRR